MKLHQSKYVSLNGVIHPPTMGDLTRVLGVNVIFKQKHNADAQLLITVAAESLFRDTNL